MAEPTIQEQARAAILSAIRSLHRDNALDRKATRERLARSFATEDRRQRDSDHLEFTITYERELNIAIHAAEEAFRVSATTS